jgi:hypothetical protein
MSHFVTRHLDSNDAFFPVDSGVDLLDPRESKNDIFLATMHDIEFYCLEDSCDSDVQEAGEFYIPIFVFRLVDVSNRDGMRESFFWEVVFVDKMPIDARDVGS